MAQPTLTPREFAQKWADNTQKESSTSREHFIDLCRMLGEPTPNEADPTGTTYAFEKAVTKAAGGDGFADVWKKDFFGWEYKGKDLKAAYLQLLGYREDLSNPPLLVVSDLDTIEIRTNFTNLSPKLYTVTLDDLAADDPSDGKSDVFSNALGELFAKMADEGGLFGTEGIAWFNGGLFDTSDVIPLTGAEITTLLEVSKLNWALIEPAIFGTLFEQRLLVVNLDRRGAG